MVLLSQSCTLTFELFAAMLIQEFCFMWLNSLHRERPEGLAHRHQLHRIDIDVGWARNDVRNGIRDVVRRKCRRQRILVHRSSLGIVALKAHIAEFRARRHTRLDVSDANEGAKQV